MDCFKGKCTGKPHDLHGNINGFSMVPVDFPLNQSIFEFHWKFLLCQKPAISVIVPGPGQVTHDKSL